MKKLILCSGIAIVLSTYLIWWDNLNVYSGIYGLDRIQDYLAVMSFVLLGMLGIWSTIKSLNCRLYFWSIIPLVVIAIYFTRIYHGPKVSELYHCDLSICDEIAFYGDGSFYFQSSSQIETITTKGYVQISGDTILLIPGFHMSLNWSRIRFGEIESKKIIHPIGFSFTFPEEFDK